MENANKASFTDGPIASRLIGFALPLMAVNLLQVFYSSADMMIVGLSSEPDAVGAVGTTLAMINLIVNSFIGISVGANVTLARALGAGEREKARRIVHTSLIFSLILGLAAMGIGLSVSRLALSAMGNRGRLLELSVLYSNIYFAGVPFLSVTNFASALLRASGDSKSPLYVLGFTGLANVLMNLAFVTLCGMSVEGVALATLFANLLSAILLVLRLDSSCKISPRELYPDRESLGELARIGIPAGVQSAIFSVSHLLIQSSILTVNNLAVGGSADFQPVVKGVSAATSLEQFANTAVSSVGQAAITFIGQNAGAKRFDRIAKIRKVAYLIAFSAATLAGGLTVLFREPLLALYGVTRDGELMQLAFESAETRIFVMMLPYFLLAFMEIGAATLQGLAKPLTATAISLTGSVAFRIIWIFTVFAATKTLTAVFLSFPISWAITGTLHLVFASRELKRCANG